MWSPSRFHCAIQPEWIDYNGHLRDAWYCAIGSLAIDAMMDELGLDAAYRKATRGTLYTLEAHVRYLKEVKAEAAIGVDLYLIEHDNKRLRTLLALNTAAGAEPAAAIEFTLLHVEQSEPPRGAPLPAMAQSRLAEWSKSPCPPELLALGSRAMTLARRG